VSHIRVLNHVLVMNVAMIQPRNGYNRYYFALDSTFFEAKWITLEARPRPNARGRGKLVKAEAKIFASVLTSLCICNSIMSVHGCLRLTHAEKQTVCVSYIRHWKIILPGCVMWYMTFVCVCVCICGVHMCISFYFVFYFLYLLHLMCSFCCLCCIFVHSNGVGAILFSMHHRGQIQHSCHPATVHFCTTMTMRR